MTIITVNTPRGRLGGDARRVLATTLTDAVLIPEVGQEFEPARVGFQVWFREFDLDAVAIGGHLLSDRTEWLDVTTVDIAVMDGAWPVTLRGEVITRVLRALADAVGVESPSAAWWVTFRTIDEGSWGSRGGPLSILSLLDSGAFSVERASAIRRAVAAS